MPRNLNKIVRSWILLLCMIVEQMQCILNSKFEFEEAFSEMEESGLNFLLSIYFAYAVGI